MNKKQLRDFARRMDDDDDDFDPNILADGERLRIPMYRLTDAQRQVATFAAQHGSQHGGAGFNRPGFVRATRDAAATARLNDAYAAAEADLVSSWKGEPVPPTGAGERQMLGAQPGDRCTVRNAEYPNDFGSPGTLQMIGGSLVCCPDNPRSPSPPPPSETSADARAIKDAAYAEHDQYLRTAYRGGQ